MAVDNAELLDRAKRETIALTNWADVSNALFDPEIGLLTRAYPDPEERKAFMKSGEYKAIRQTLAEAMEQSGLVEGATPEKSGRFVVRLPKSLHGALEQEADKEGVSLNQLVVTKLAVKLSQIQDGPKSHIASIAQAYLETRNGLSTDRVIADPELDACFLNRCRELGVSGTDYELNWQLMSARKTGYLTGMPKTRDATPRRIDDFEYASEIAIAHLSKMLAKEFPNGISLDRIICDPQIAREFDKVAARLAPEFSSLEYRWAALGVRKAAGRYKARAAKSPLPSFDRLGITRQVKASQIPAEPGIYIFRDDRNSVFIGETTNLRNRVERHFEYSDKRGIPEWVYDGGRLKMELGIAALGSSKDTARKISELRAIFEYAPLLNYHGSAA